MHDTSCYVEPRPTRYCGCHARTASSCRTKRWRPRLCTFQQHGPKSAKCLGCCLVMLALFMSLRCAGLHCQRQRALPAGGNGQPAAAATATGSWLCTRHHDMPLLIDLPPAVRRAHYGVHISGRRRAGGHEPVLRTAADARQPHLPGAVLVRVHYGASRFRYF